MVKELNIKSRALRVRIDDSESDPYSDEIDVTSPSILSTGSGDDDEEEEDPVEALKQVSFCDLLAAKESLGAQAKDTARGDLKRKRSSYLTQEKLEELRMKIRELQQNTRSKTDPPKGQSAQKSSSSKPPKVSTKDSDTDSDDQIQYAGSDSEDDAESEGDISHNPESDDNSDSEEDNKSQETSKRKRSKHAPTEMRSDRQVPRLGPTKKTSKLQSRDPRFAVGVVTGNDTESVIRKRYAFLDEYRQSEMDTIKKTLSDDKAQSRMTAKQRRKLRDQRVALSSEEREELVATLQRMQNQARSNKDKERLESVEQEHMKKERELVRQGKKAAPFYLKKGDIKRLALEEKYTGMKAKERDQAMDRRLKKIASKEKKAMPTARRGRE